MVPQAELSQRREVHQPIQIVLRVRVDIEVSERWQVGVHNREELLGHRVVLVAERLEGRATPYQSQKLLEQHKHMFCAKSKTCKSHKVYEYNTLRTKVSARWQVRVYERGELLGHRVLLVAQGLGYRSS